jgi:hypothetical protein
MGKVTLFLLSGLVIAFVACATTEGAPSDGDDEGDRPDGGRRYDASDDVTDDPSDDPTDDPTDDDPEPIDAGIDARPELVIDAGPDAMPPDPLDIDNLEDGNDSIITQQGRRGDWYSYNDGTAGVQMPPTSSFASSSPGADGSARAARTTGHGFTLWGAGMGFDLNSLPNPGGGVGRIDGSAYTGISFKAKGTGAMRVNVQTVAVLLVASGGTCVAGATEEEACEDAHGKDIPLTSTWTTHKVPWTGMTQVGWGKMITFDKTKLTGILWQVEQGVTFDFWIDDIKFY